MNEFIIRRDGSVMRVIKATDAQAGMTLAYDNHRWDEYIDEVADTRDGQVVLYTGREGTGTNWRDADEPICVVFSFV